MYVQRNLPRLEVLLVLQSQQSSLPRWHGNGVLVSIAIQRRTRESSEPEEESARGGAGGGGAQLPWQPAVGTFQQ